MPGSQKPLPENSPLPARRPLRSTPCETPTSRPGGLWTTLRRCSTSPVPPASRTTASGHASRPRSSGATAAGPSRTSGASSSTPPAFWETRSGSGNLPTSTKDGGSEKDGTEPCPGAPRTPRSASNSSPILARYPSLLSLPASNGSKLRASTSRTSSSAAPCRKSSATRRGRSSG